MEMDKIRNLDQEELAQQGRQAAEQVFRLRFQLRMGQNEGLKKFRELKKDIARIQTAERQRELVAEAEQTPGGVKRRRSHRKTTKTKARTGKSAGKSSRKTSKKNSGAAGKAKAGGSSKVKAAKRGKANAKKGGS